MQKLMCFSAFLYQYIESIMFLEFARRGGGYSPPSPPPKSATVVLQVFSVDLQIILHTHEGLSCQSHVPLKVWLEYQKLTYSNFIFIINFTS